MKEIDYIIVGLGIAGITFSEQLEKHSKSFVVFNAPSTPATEISGGVFNPVVLKRFTPVWNAQEFSINALQFYKKLALKFKIELVEEMPVWRIFNSVEEQNNWMVASDKIALSSFLSSEVIKNTNTCINAPFGFGGVHGSGRIFPKVMLSTYKKFLLEKDQYIPEAFNYDKLSERKDGKLHYQDYSATKIVFCEGARVIDNPFFKKELLIGNKGEYLYIKAPDLKLLVLLKGSMFIIPVGNDIYKVGATYSRDDYSTNATSEAKEQIVTKLKKMLHCDFEVIDQVAGIRPTVKDRKPLLGVLPENPNKAFFNGLGTRGLMMAPTLAQYLYEFLEEGKTLSSEVDINRFI